jgi:hypothetical protein
MNEPINVVGGEKRGEVGRRQDGGTFTYECAAELEVSPPKAQTKVG